MTPKERNIYHGIAEKYLSRDKCLLQEMNSEGFSPEEIEAAIDRRIEGFLDSLEEIEACIFYENGKADSDALEALKEAAEVVLNDPHTYIALDNVIGAGLVKIQAERDGRFPRGRVRLTDFLRAIVSHSDEAMPNRGHPKNKGSESLLFSVVHAWKMHIAPPTDSEGGVLSIVSHMSGDTFDAVRTRFRNLKKTGKF